MNIAGRIKDLREAKNLSQGDIEKRTGLLRCYISRVENGHTVPSLETLEKISRSLEVPLYQLLYDGNEVQERPAKASHRTDWASKRKGKRLFEKLCHAVARMSDRDRETLMFTTSKLVSSRNGNSRGRS